MTLNIEVVLACWEEGSIFRKCFSIKLKVNCCRQEAPEGCRKETINLQTDDFYRPLGPQPDMFCTQLACMLMVSTLDGMEKNLLACLWFLQSQEPP